MAERLKRTAEQKTAHKNRGIALKKMHFIQNSTIIYSGFAFM